MAYDKNSAEARLGAWCESFVADLAIKNRWYVLHTSQTGRGATMVTGPNGKKIVMPDLQLLDPVRRRESRFVEVKAKSGAYTFHKKKIICTGIDLLKWKEYRKINSSGVPVDLAFVHLHWPLRSSPEIRPTLLWQTVERLNQLDPMLFEDPQFPGGAIVWNVAHFQLLGNFPNPPPDIIEALQTMAGKCNLRIWEKPPRPRRPREMPGQYSLFPELMSGTAQALLNRQPWRRIREQQPPGNRE
jgi:hypothetical protein